MGVLLFLGAFIVIMAVVSSVFYVVGMLFAITPFISDWLTIESLGIVPGDFPSIFAWIGLVSSLLLFGISNILTNIKNGIMGGD